MTDAISDDDGGLGLSSRLVFAPPQNGVYRVIVNSLNEGVEGQFRLSVLRQR